ncbi:ABC transporter ATP-binding protein [Paenibacillus gallinarum]|uniref:ATP-binding cassette domain-containing protein n=1 Tax=Paenibacillus gallinarum TaxID=2762232 RepID=A0ABR8T426_9BACL|nr:ATP-binding cassette domain-containing protein [Paenibacillus gallinarum]MBD7970511.1 ATP-binding cassette domain-containing protein [Paenibacillus gallinarum]
MIEVQGLHKEFKTPIVKDGNFAGLRALFSREYTVKHAVQNISFQIEPGEFVGYIGPNGAGKSTTIKMLTGILHPSSGKVRVNGMNPHQQRRQVVRRLGVVFGQRSQLWWDLPVKDSYDILAKMYRVDDKDKHKRLEEFAALLDLKEFWDTPVRKLSLGQRMRADLGASMLHDPDILFLDEPTIGLDVNAKRNIRSFLKLLNRDFGKTILLTTHDMDDIEQLCSRVMVINHGQLTYDGTVQSLRENIGLPTIIKVSYLQDIQSSSLAGFHHEAVKIIGRTERTITVEANRNRIGTMQILAQLGEWGELADVEMQEPDFEDVIHKVY